MSSESMGTLLARFGVDAGATLVRQSANHVFRATREGRDVYIRITTDDHRAREEIVAEVEWMNALAEAGARVVRPLPSQQGRFVEEAGIGGNVAYAICLLGAEGRPARKPDDFSPAVVRAWAGLLADLHRHARSYLPPSPARRPPWHADRVFSLACEAKDARVAPASARLAELAGWLRGRDTDPDGYGLTHADLHLGNLAIFDRETDGAPTVTAFDFDDACEHWYAHDLGVAVTSIRKGGWEHAFDAAALEATFLEAYARCAALPEVWFARLEAFVAYRIVISACWASRASELGLLDDDMRAWFERSLPWWRAELTRRVQAIDRALAV